MGARPHLTSQRSGSAQASSPEVARKEDVSAAKSQLPSRSRGAPANRNPGAVTGLATSATGEGAPLYPIGACG
jgi:hypothetical protein